MEKFVPFQDFQKELAAAQQKQQAAGGGAHARPEGPEHREVTADELQEIHDYLAAQNRKMEVVHSYMGDDGHWIDCVKIETQPGLEPGHKIAAPPALVTRMAAERARSATGEPEDASPRLDRFGNAMRCPAGTIPVRRVTFDQIRRTGSLKNYFEKAPGGGAMPPAPGTP